MIALNLALLLTYFIILIIFIIQIISHNFACDYEGDASDFMLQTSFWRSLSL